MAPKMKRRKVEMLDDTSVVLMGVDVDKIYETLLSLKSSVETTETLNETFEACPQLGDVLTSLLWKCSIQDYSKELRWVSILKEVLSVLANFCLMSSDFRLKMAEPPKNIAMIAVRVLESGDKTPLEIKRTLLRLLANIGTDRKCAQMISNNSQLVDRIAIAIGHDDDEIVKVALRTVRALVVNKCGFKPLLLSNIGFYLGNLLQRTSGNSDIKAQEFRNAVFYLICCFVKSKGAKEIGRQLAASGGVNVLLSCFLKGQYEEVVVEMCSASFELREQFETPGCIQKIVEAPQPRSEYMLKVLLCFAQDAWGRAALRCQGALDVLIDWLDEGSCQQQELIVNALRYFVHDGIGLNYITFCTKFLDVVVEHINCFLDKNQRVCKLVKDGFAEVPLYENMTDHSKGCLCCSIKTKYGSPVKSMTPVSFDSPSRSVGAWNSTRRSWSPSQSPPPGSSSPPHSSPSPASSFSSLMDEYIESVERPCHVEDFKMRSDVPLLNTYTQLVVGEVYILAWLSHSENNMQRLMTPKIIDTLLRYIAEAPSTATKAPRTVRRIFRHRLAVEDLARLELHTRVVHILMTRKCSSRKKWGKCGECLTRESFGMILLNEFASHIDAPFGLEVLKNLYKSGNELDELKACIATLHLVRRKDNWTRMLAEHQPVKRLLAKIREMLVDSNYEEKWRYSTYENGPSLLRQMLVSFGFLVSEEMLLSAMRGSPFHLLECLPSRPCVLMEASMTLPDNSLEMIKFTCGNLKETVPKKYLCEGSEYFRGMFGNAFSEQCTSRSTFEFNKAEEQCSFTVFCYFLHFMCGCGRDCFTVEEDDVPALLKLCDRYLCEALRNLLLAQSGPVKYLINGATLPDYLEVLLTTGCDKSSVLRDACLGTLIRFCTEDEMFEALKVVAGNAVATGALVEHLEKFLGHYCRDRSILLH